MKEVKIKVPIYDIDTSKKGWTYKPIELKELKGFVAFERYGRTWVIHPTVDNWIGSGKWKISDFKTGCGIGITDNNKQILVSLVKKYLKDRHELLPKEIKRAEKMNKKYFGQSSLN